MFSLSVKNWNATLRTRGGMTRGSVREILCLQRSTHLRVYDENVRNPPAFKLSLRIQSRPALFLSDLTAPVIQPSSRLHTQAAFHANLNIILRIMALMLSTIRVPYTLHTYELSTLIIVHEIRSGFLSPGVKLIYIGITIWIISQLLANRMIFHSH